MFCSFSFALLALAVLGFTASNHPFGIFKFVEYNINLLNHYTTDASYMWIYVGIKLIGMLSQFVDNNKILAEPHRSYNA